MLQLLAPYIAVLAFWCIFKNGWLAILAYHAQILFWLKPGETQHKLNNKRILLTALPTVLAGPILYFLLPYIAKTNLSIWLEEYQISGLSLMLMIPYFGIIHPYLEELHWQKIREKNYISHIVFAGYHIIVLYSFVKIPWLIACFFTLATASTIWQYTTKKTNSIVPAVISHILADLSIIIAVYIIQ